MICYICNENKKTRRVEIIIIDEINGQSGMIINACKTCMDGLSLNDLGNAIINYLTK